jgi:hypothetical protein
MKQFGCFAGVYIAIYLTLICLLVWAVISYGQRWEDCRTDGGTFKFFSGDCVQEDKNA